MLVIYSVDLENSCNDLLEILQDIEFVADSWKEDAFLVGNQFMRQVSFVGCMPFLRTDPKDGENICYVELPPTTAQPQLYVADSARKPRCPECGAVVSGNEKTATTVVCDDCGVSSGFHELNRGARLSCWTRQRLNIHQINKGDAAPSEEFLDILKARTGLVWDYSFF